MSPVRFAVLLLLPFTLRAQEAYRTPPRVVSDVLDAPPLPSVNVSPDRTWLALAERAAMPTIAELSQPMLRLAGVRINPRTNGPHRGIAFTAIRLRSIDGRQERTITTPAGAKLSLPLWSHDGRRLAFTATTDSGIALWVADAATGAARAVTAPRLNAVLGPPCAWMPSSTALLCTFVPEGRGAAPVEAAVPAGPNVHIHDGRAAAVRTYEDLLATPHDERVFDHYATSRLGRVSVTGGAVTYLGEPGLIDDARVSPDGRWLLVQTVRRPYSYQVPVGLFPRAIELWDANGAVVRRLADLPLADNVPTRGVRNGPRSIHWRPNRPATVVWAEPLDGGDPRVRVAHRDRLVALTLPATEPVEIARTAWRYRVVTWGERDGLAVVAENDRATRRTRSWVIDPDRAGAAPRELFNRDTEDSYGDPGQFVGRPSGSGEQVMLQSPDGRYLYLSGQGASPEGDRPFIDRLDLRTLRTERLFRAADPYYETVVTVLDAGATRLLTSRESRAEPPNYFVRDVRSGAATPLTAFTDPAPQLAGIGRRLVTYRRSDGVQLSGTLYTPPGYVAGTRLPLVLWVYPAEFASAEAAGQIRGSPNRFTRIAGASHLFLLTQGYAVLDNPTLPVIGGDTANNGYVRQVVMGAQAAIDHVVGLGIADRARVGVGGHSYGAFTTANLLAHSDLFRTGIARSGAYNRTLTPFGFQAEERTYWQARDVYTGMSPFTFADRINEPLLLIHGEMDDNSGTFPVQSDRMYAALKGLGATVTLVTYPYEAHGYASRETILDCVARMIEWYDRFVKPDVPARAAASSP